MAATTWNELRGGLDQRPAHSAISQRLLTFEQAQECRRRWLSGEASQSAMAREFGVARQTINDICTGDTYQEALPMRRFRPGHFANRLINAKTWTGWAREHGWSDARIAAAEAERLRHREPRWTGACPCCGSTDPRRCLTLDEMPAALAAD